MFHNINKTHVFLSSKCLSQTCNVRASICQQRDFSLFASPTPLELFSINRLPLLEDQRYLHATVFTTYIAAQNAAVSARHKQTASKSTKIS